MNPASASTASASPARQLTGSTLFLLAGLAALGALSTNIILPAFPAIGAQLQASPQRLGLTLSAFFLAFALGQLLVGPLSDRIGRKWLVLGGLATFFAGSVLCALAGSLSMLVLGRVVQALGACAASVLSRAIARDIFDGAALARALAMTMTAMAAAPGFSPLVGGLLQSAVGWRATFVIVGLCGLVLAVHFHRALGESHPADRRTRVSAGVIVASYGRLAVDPLFAFPALAVSLLIGGLYTYFSLAPAIIMGGIGLNAFQFGLFFAVTVFVVFGVGFLAPRLAVGWGHRNAALAGFAVALAGSAVLFLGGGTPGLATVTVSWVVFILGMGVANPLGTALTLQPFASRAGLASALLGFLQMAIAATGALVANALPFAPVVSLAIVLTACSGLALVALLAGNQIHLHPSNPVHCELKCNHWGRSGFDVGRETE